jgi:hypothetical protein
VILYSYSDEGTPVSTITYDFERGDRVTLVRTTDTHTRLRPGDQGTVTYVRDGGLGMEVGVRWDSGSGLTMLVDEGDVISKEVQD